MKINYKLLTTVGFALLVLFYKNVFWSAIVSLSIPIVFSAMNLHVLPYWKEILNSLKKDKDLVIYSLAKIGAVVALCIFIQDIAFIFLIILTLFCGISKTVMTALLRWTSFRKKESGVKIGEIYTAEAVASFFWMLIFGLGMYDLIQINFIITGEIDILMVLALTLVCTPYLIEKLIRIFTQKRAVPAYLKYRGD